MPDRPFFTLEAAVNGLNKLRLGIADPDAGPPALKGKLRLFDDTVTVDSSTTRADLIAAEIASAGYPVGGFDITAYTTPIKGAAGGAITSSNLIDISVAAGAGVVVGGYWIDDAKTPTAEIFEVQIYSPARPLAVATDAWPIVHQFGFGGNPLA